MADNVSGNANITIHQLVHGYSEGHRELAGSLRLDTRDARNLSVLSDISSAGLRIAGEGYLTGYPLFESSFYVLARTWPATEVSRPGAVWTHSLLIEFSDLAEIRDARTLLPLFRRPSPSESSWERAYRRPLNVDVITTPLRVGLTSLNVKPWDLSPKMEDWLLHVLTALYERPTERIVAPLPSRFDFRLEDVVLALWSQQWPRLRRSFRFCTATMSDRQVERTAFDLQLCPEAERGSRSRFPGAVFVGDEVQVSAADWLWHALEDLQQPGLSSLRDFLVAVGGSASKGRGSFIPLVRIHQIVAAKLITAEGAAQARRMINDELDGPSPVAAAMLTNACAKNIEQMAPETQDFVLTNANLLGDAEFAAVVHQIGRAVWRRSKARFADLTKGSERHRLIAIVAIRHLPTDDLISGLVEAPEMVGLAVHERPELLAEVSLWSSNEPVISAALHALAGASDDLPATLRVIVSVDSPHLRQLAKNMFGAETLWRAVAETANAQPDGLSEPLGRWIQALSPDTGELAAVLAGGAFHWRASLHAIALSVGPDAVPNAFGDDPWLIAREHASGEFDAGSSVFFSSYLLARALGSSSRNCAGLVEVSFEEVYDSAARDAVPSSAWSLLALRLPQPGYWQTWDRCKQLRYAVAQLYVGRGLSPKSFAKLGRNDDLFRQLVTAVAKEWHGKAYLRDVRRELEYGGRVSLARLEVIDEQLSSWL